MKINRYYMALLETDIKDLERYGWVLRKIRPSRWYEGGRFVAVLDWVK